MSLEIEFKLRLEDAAAVERVTARIAKLELARSEPVRQVNHFFDTRGFALRADRCALRLRVENQNQFLLTAKGSAATDSQAGASVQLETEAAISAELATKLLRAETDPLAALRAAVEPGESGESKLLTRLDEIRGSEVLQQCGQFENLRTTFGPWPIVAGLPVFLELDQTDFGTRIDFEMEAEVQAEQASDVRAALEDLLADADIAWRVATSKAQRFFELRA